MTVCPHLLSNWSYELTRIDPWPIIIDYTISPETGYRLYLLNFGVDEKWRAYMKVELNLERVCTLHEFNTKASCMDFWTLKLHLDVSIIPLIRTDTKQTRQTVKFV